MLNNTNLHLSTTTPSTTILLQLRPPCPYTFPLKNLVTSNNKPSNGFIVYRRAYYNIINKNGYNLKMNKLSFIASKLWKQEPSNVKLHYCDLARKIRSMPVRLRSHPTTSVKNNISNRNNRWGISQQSASPIQNPPMVAQSNTDIYIDFEELALHMNQGIPIPTQTVSVLDVSPSFETSFF